jgi:hypothetical protein
MLAQSFLSFALLACGTLAAPTPSNTNELEKRASWQEGKCEAEINVNSKLKIPLSHPTLNQEKKTNANPQPTVPRIHGLGGLDYSWSVTVKDIPGNPIGKWSGWNPVESQRNVNTDKGNWFYIRGQPGWDRSPNALTLQYFNQKWSSVDCWNYIWEEHDATKGYEWWHQYRCQFDC